MSVLGYEQLQVLAHLRRRCPGRNLHPRPGSFKNSAIHRGRAGAIVPAAGKTDERGFLACRQEGVTIFSETRMVSRSNTMVS